MRKPWVLGIWTVFLALAAGALVAALLIWHSEQTTFRERQAALANQARAAALNAVGGAADVFRGASGQVTSNGRFLRSSFDGAAPEFLASGSLSGIAFEPLIPAAGRADAEARLHHRIFELAAGAGFRPAGARAFYAPVTWVAPADATRRALIGFDILSEPRRAVAARRAAASGTPQLTAPFALAGTRAPGFSVFYPLFRSGGIPATPAARHAELLGWYTGGVASQDLARKLFGQLPKGTALRVVDVGAGDERVLGSVRPLHDDTSRTVRIAGRLWRVSVASDRPNPLAALIIGIGGVLLAVLVVFSLLQSRRRLKAVLVARRLTERERARQVVLVRAAESMERTTDADERLRRLAAALVPDLGDLVHVAVVGDGLALDHVATVAISEEVERTAAAQPVRADVAPVVEAFRTGRPQFVDAPDEELLRAASIDEGHARYRVDLAIRGAIVVPLVARGRPLGALFIVRLGPDAKEFDAGDLALSAEIGAHAALALDNARAYELERDISQTLQRALLPPRLPDMRPLVAAARFRAAGERVEVGGDVYDVIRTAENQWLTVIADVCGKGPRAAALTATARYAVRTLADGVEPAQLLGAVNRELARQTRDDLFVTIALARLTIEADGRTARVLLASGGHPAPLIVRGDGRVETLSAAGPLVGVDATASFAQTAADLHPGDVLLLYTDGVTEARRDGDLFGDDRLLAAAAIGAAGEGDLSGRAELVVERVEQTVLAWTSGTPQDDIALLAIGLA